MTRTESAGLRRACTVLLMVVVGCSGAAPTVITASSDVAPVRLPEFDGPEELEEALVSFGECVEETFPIVMRFRADPFLGLTTEVISQREEDGDSVDRVTAVCSGTFDLDRRLAVYQGEHPISPDQQLALVDDFISCTTTVSPAIAERVSKAALDSLSSVDTLVFDLDPRTSGLTGAELVAVSDCHSEITGPEMVFGVGHPWFTP